MNPNTPYKDIARTRYPHACAESEANGIWGVWDISHDKRKRLDMKHLPETFSRCLLGLGKTENEAWLDAVRTIEKTI